MKDFVFLEYSENVAIIRMSRTESLNALNREVICQLDDALNRIEADSTARAVILIGDGNFAAGADIDSMVEFTPKQAREFAFGPVYGRLEQMPIPTIAAVEGYALGGGLELALCCDFRIAADNAVVGLPEINLGIMPGGGGTIRLPRIIGEAKAKELIMLGRLMKTDEALSAGLFTKVVRQEQLMDEAMNLASRLTAKADTAIAAAKRMIQKNVIAERYEEELKEWALLFDTYNQKEGMKAFLEKRDAVFVKEY